MAFVLTDHALLSDDSAALDPTVLTAHTALAADLLDLADYEESITDSDYNAKALRALALQVNYQLVHDHDAEAHRSEILTGYHRVYSDKDVSDKARLLAEQVLSSLGVLGQSQPEFATLRSRR